MTFRRTFADRQNMGNFLIGETKRNKLCNLQRSTLQDALTRCIIERAQVTQLLGSKGRRAPFGGMRRLIRRRRRVTGHPGMVNLTRVCVCCHCQLNDARRPPS